MIIKGAQKLSILSALSCRLTMLTGKSKYPIHPKHLIIEELWFEKYLKKNDNLLDLGCNSGQMLLKVKKKVNKAVGLDNDFKLIAIAKTQLDDSRNIKFKQHDLNKGIPYSNNSFTKVICNDVLEHVYKRGYLLKEIYRVLKPGGMLFLVTDNPNTSWKKLQKSMGLEYYADSDHKYEYPQQTILKSLRISNFEVMSVDNIIYDTPLTGLIDLTGGISLKVYQKLRAWRKVMVQKYPADTTGFRILAVKK